MQTKIYDGSKAQKWQISGPFVRPLTARTKVLAGSEDQTLILQNFNNSMPQLFEFEDNFLVPQNCDVSNCLNQKLTLGKERVYFFIISKLDAKALTAERFNIGVTSYTGADNQLWFWDVSAIRNKQFSHLALTLENSFLQMEEFRGLNEQSWQYTNNMLYTKDRSYFLERSSNGQYNKLWSFQTKPIDYFVIKSYFDAKVLTTSSSQQLSMTHQTSGDDQVWFLTDDHFLRSKKFPDKVLTAFSEKLQLSTFTGNDNQHLFFENQSLLIGKDRPLSLDYEGITILVKPITGKVSQKWSFSEATIHQEFTILNGELLKYFCANFSGSVHSCDDGKSDGSIWFFDDNYLRSKKFPEKVVTHQNGNLLLENFDGKLNQEWDTSNFYIQSFANSDFVIELAANGNVLMGNINSANKLQRWYITSGIIQEFLLCSGEDASCFMSNRFWLWDGEYLRLKGSTKHYLTAFDQAELLEFNGQDNQKWEFEGFHLKSLSTGQYLNRNGNLEDVVDDAKQKWLLLSTSSFEYFSLRNGHSQKIMCATSESEIGYCTFDKNDWSQQWFLTNNYVRSRKYPQKVMDLHADQYDESLTDPKAKVFLQSFNGRSNQEWIFENNNICSEYKGVCLDGFWETAKGVKKDNHLSQNWIVYDSSQVEEFSICSADTATFLQYNGSFLWIWDGEYLRSKGDTNYYLTAVDGSSLQYFSGLDNQKWEFDDFRIRSVGTGKCLNNDIRFVDSSNDVKVKWMLVAHPSLVYTAIVSDYKQEALCAKSEQSLGYCFLNTNDWSQQWYISHEFIRSRKYPDKVVDLHALQFDEKSKGDVYLHPFHGDPNQRWTLDNGKICSAHKGACIDGFWDDLKGTPSDNHVSQKWTLFPTSEYVYFSFQSQHNQKVLCATSEKDIGYCNFDKNDWAQHWFFTNEFIRSRKYKNKVVDLHTDQYNENSKGSVYLHSFHGRDNQVWILDGGKICSKYKGACVDAFWDELKGAPTDNHNSQKWIVFDPNQVIEPKSCADKTEEDINSVVQWIPLVSTVWDLGASIGYAAAGCKNVAEERAISFGIGVALDLATAGTLKVGSVVLKGGITGVKQISLHGIKHVAKTSIKQVGKVFSRKAIKGTISKLASKAAISKGAKSSAKFAYKEIVKDNLKLYKNIAKGGIKALANPKNNLKAAIRSVKSTAQSVRAFGSRIKTGAKRWKEARKSKLQILRHADEMEESLLKKGVDVPNIRCKRSSGPSCFTVLEGLPQSQPRTFPEKIKSFIENPDEHIGQIGPVLESFKQNSPLARAIRNDEVWESLDKIGDITDTLGKIKSFTKDTKPKTFNQYVQKLPEPYQKYINEQGITKLNAAEKLKGLHEELQELSNGYKVNKDMFDSWRSRVKAGDDSYLEEIAVYTYTDKMNFNHFIRNPDQIPGEMSKYTGQRNQGPIQKKLFCHKC